jgi:cytoskeletal protein CcmA (bactofilin family)
MRAARVLALVILLTLGMASDAAAADVRQGESITIASGDTIEDDLYAFGNSIAINGTVKGDVVAAGNNVSVDGTITGSLIVAANRVSIRGQVGGSVRAAGASVFVDGKIAGDLFVAAADTTTSASAQVGRDAYVAGSTVTLGGQIGRNASVGGRAATIDGHVGGDVRAQIETLRLTEKAAVDGFLSYVSASDASVASGAVVKGPMTRSAPPQNPTQVASGPTALAIDWLRGLVGLLLLGLFLVLFFPAFSRRSGEIIVTSPFTSLGVGVLVLIGVPILAVLIFIIGALIGGWWLGLIALAFYFAAIAVSIPIAALGLGASIMRVTRRPSHLVIALIVGLVILMLVGLVPILGGVVLFIACLFGLGGTMIAVVTGRRAEPVAA